MHLDNYVGRGRVRLTDAAKVPNTPEMVASEPTMVCLNAVPKRDGYSNSLSTLCSNTPLFDLIGFENCFDD